MDVSTRKHLTQLMTRLADGERSVFDEVYAALWPIISAFCSKTLPRADAEDAAQQALVKLFDQAASFDRDRDAVTWALSIAVWEVRTMRRRYQRAKTAELLETDMAAVGESPETLTEQRQLTEAARAALGQLSSADQETLRATFAEQGSPGVTGATFRKRRERALARLKVAWRRVYAS